MSPYIKILRPSNCLIVGLTQFLVYFLLFLPIIEVPSLNNLTLFALILATMLVTASGFVINDIIDRDLDAINKSDKKLVGAFINLSSAWRYYYLLIGIGFMLSLFVAYSCGELGLIWLYPLMVLLLWMYSQYWKGRAVIGNLVVSLFTAFVPGLLLVAERKAINQAIMDERSGIYYFLISVTTYMLFAFLSNLTRELIKDIEDVEGDRMVGHRTLPVVVGVRKSKMVAMVYASCILIILFFCNIFFVQFSITLAWIITSIVLIPINAFILFKIYKASERSDFSFVSNQLKLFMVLGLVSILTISHYLYS